MSGLYLIAVVLLWAWLTRVLLRFGWRVVVWEGKAFTAKTVLVGILSLAWFAASFWYGGGRKFYYDWQVEKMCAVDGGVKVYETVRLPAERFDEFGNVHITNKAMIKPGDEYYSESETMFLRHGHPNIVRMHTRIIRRSDDKVLGESVHYGRGGGDLIGPWFPSGFTCPEPNAKPYLEPSIFHKEASK